MASLVRLQRSRAKGTRLVSPNGLPIRCVDRTTKWGNPYKVMGAKGTWHVLDSVACMVLATYPMRQLATQRAIEIFTEDLLNGRMLRFTTEDIYRELKGFNLACWCALPEQGQPDLCHAAILLRLANA